MAQFSWCSGLDRLDLKNKTSSLLVVMRGKFALYFSFGEIRSGRLIEELFYKGFLRRRAGEWVTGRLTEVAVLSGGRPERFHCSLKKNQRSAWE